MQDSAGDSVEVAFVDQGCADEQTADAAARHSTQYRQALPTAKWGFILLPRRWAVERTFGAWLATMSGWIRPRPAFRCICHSDGLSNCYV
ncbi:MAG: hypothetical protein ACTFAK_13830 [Candidatus Electronema sp. VV]